MPIYKRLMPILLIPLLLLTGCQHSVSAPEFETLSSANFDVYYVRGDQPAAQAVLDILEANQARITADLMPAKTGKYSVMIYPNLKALHKAMDMPDAPDWVVGTAWSDSEMRIVSPSHPGPSHSYASILKVAVHEFAHCVTMRLTAESDSAPCIWLWESIALYQAGQSRDLASLPYMQTGQYPRFLEATDPSQSTYIYQLGYSIADYIVHIWGKESIRKLVLNSGAVTEVLGITEDEFYAGWHAFVKANYLK